MNAQPLADVLAIVARLFCGATLRVPEDAAPFESGQRVYIPNHSSHLDFVVLWSALPRPLRRTTRPVAARDYWHKTAMRRFLSVHVYHAILIEREHISVHANPIDQIAEEMGEDSLILFPEGTRGNGEEVGAFKSGVYHLAQRKPHLQYVPVYIENLNRVLPKGEILPLPLLSSITLGAPLQLREGESKVEFLTRLRAAVVALKENPE